MNKEFVDKVFRAGVVGCGGAGFPTHVKLQKSAEWFIVNGAECEPLLYTDRFLMRNHAGALVAAAGAMAAHLKAAHCVIALKESYLEEIACLQAAIECAEPDVSLCLLGSFYPAGDEQQVVHMATGRVVPAGGIPLDVGVVVNNVATVLAVGEALVGIPLTHKTVTVAGAVCTPALLQVPVGTAIAKCIEAVGGRSCEDGRIVMGGPLMGRLLPKEQEAAEVVTKTTSGILVLPEDNPLISLAQTDVRHTLNRARSACIQCCYCTMQCPRYLLGHPLQPHRIMRKLAYSQSLQAMLQDKEVQQALICCECGICELHACPMGLQPRLVNILLKQLYAQEGFRYRKEEEPCVARPELAWRKIPARRMAARTGILPYYHEKFPKVLTLTPSTLCIPLRQHIGAAALPVVAIGDAVQAGQMVAACPEGALGANVHTGLAGTVTAINDRIAITSQEGEA